MLSSLRVAELRSRFPVFRHKIYLNSCSQGALSQDVRDGFDSYLASWDAHGSPWEHWVDQYEDARRLFAEFIGALPEEVALLPSASAGINSIASALNFQGRARVVLGAFEFPTMGHVWLAQQARGAEVQFVEADGERMPSERYSQFVDERTAIVPITGVCFRNGWRSKVKEIGAYARAAGALVMLDDYQDCGTRPVDVKALDVDIYVSGTLKYLLGPAGLAFMYVRGDVAKKLLPTISGWFAQTNPFAFDVRHLDLANGAKRFEAGTPAIPNIYGARAAVKLLQSIGMQPVAEHVADLASALIRGAQDLGIRLKTPLDSVGPLIVLRCHDAEALVNRLAAQGIVVSNRQDGLRVGLHVYNTHDDIEALLAALRANLDLLVVGSRKQHETIPA